MKILEDLWSSISGNAKTKVDDPFIGAFAASWIACNWNHLALLIWGEGNASERINAFYHFLSESKLLAINSILFYPAIFTVFYLFLFPWVSLLLKSLQRAVNDKLHKQAVSFELDRVIQQEDLNKVKLRSNPEKEFLAQSVQLDINTRKEQIELLKQQSIQEKEKAEAEAANAAAAKSKAEAEAANAIEAKSKENIAKLDEESKQRTAEIERERFNVTSSKLRSTIASYRFPSIYQIMSLIDASVSQDGIKLSLTAIEKIMAAVFGYKDFQEIVEDKQFNSETLSGIEYIYYEREDLARKLEEIVINEQSENEDLSSDLLFDHVLTMFENLPIRLVASEELEEICSDYFDNNNYDILQHEGVSGAIAISDSFFEDVEFETIDCGWFDGKLSALIIASATGGHRKDNDIPGRDMTIEIEVQSTLKLGRYAFGALEFSRVKGTLRDINYKFEDGIDDKKSPGKDWSNEELLASVEAYRQMAEKQGAGLSYSKKQVYEELAARFDRTANAFEYRMHNISAVLNELGLPWIPGLKPTMNVGTNMKVRLIQLIQGKTSEKKQE